MTNLVLELSSVRRRTTTTSSLLLGFLIVVALAAPQWWLPTGVQASPLSSLFGLGKLRPFGRQHQRQLSLQEQVESLFQDDIDDNCNDNYNPPCDITTTATTFRSDMARFRGGGISHDSGLSTDTFTAASPTTTITPSSSATTTLPASSTSSSSNGRGSYSSAYNYNKHDHKYKENTQYASRSWNSYPRRTLDYNNKRRTRNTSSSSSSSNNFQLLQPLGEWWSDHISPNLRNLPKIQCRVEPTTTLKIRKTFRPLKTIIQFGADFNTQLGVWQFKSSWEDALIGGKLTLAGRSELQFTKSWQLSVVQDLVTRLRLRAAVDLHTWKAYARVGFRTERLAPINVMEGFTLFQQIPLDGTSGHVKLEVKAHFALPEPEIEYSTETQRSIVGMGDITVNVEELNLLLDY